MSEPSSQIIHHDQSNLLRHFRCERRSVLRGLPTPNQPVSTTKSSSSGPKVHHQVPADSIVPSPSSAAIPLFHFPTLAPWLIPHPTLCNAPITLLTESDHRILSHPVSIASPHYPRNAYTFNFALVLDADTPFQTYIPVVRKLATLFGSLEEQALFLSRPPHNPPNTGPIYALCEILLEDLNNYCECQTPLDAANTLHLKLFPTYPPPPPLHPWHVPLCTFNLTTLARTESWDLTMLRLLPHINGVNSVKQIALLADADAKLVRKAIRHLLYYGCLLLLDIFSFAAIYAPTASIATFVEDAEMQEECARYVMLPRVGKEAETQLGGARLAELYLSVRQGLSVRQWCEQRGDVVAKMDVRRFFTFGVIKGFLYRVHRYAVATEAAAVGGWAKGKGLGAKADGGRAGKELGRFLDGTHCFDEICTELMVSEKDLIARLKAIGGVQVICR